MTAEHPAVAADVERTDRAVVTVSDVSRSFRDLSVLNSAFRGLVFRLSLAPTGASVPDGPGAVVAVVGLFGWWLLALVTATVTAWRA